MEDALQRARYTRTGSAYRRKRKNINENNAFLEKIIKQAFFCICILVVIGIVKNINTPVTNFASEKVKFALFQNIELKSIYTTVDEFFSNILKSKTAKDSASTSEQISSSVSNITPVKENTGAGSSAIDNNMDNLQGSDDLVKTINLKYKFLTPVQGNISSPFGERMHPLLKKITFHSGVDIEANNGDDIIAVLGGTIAETGIDVNLGNYIKIKSGDDLQTVYAHCSKTLFKKGEKIKQGQVIGYVGDTGLAVGAHLHFEVWIKQKAYDPMSFIKVIT